MKHCVFAPQPNCKFNVDAKIGHAFGIIMALFCAMPFGHRRQLTSSLNDSFPKNSAAALGRSEPVKDEKMKDFVPQRQ